MPNHVHFILIIPSCRGIARNAPTLGMLVGFLKSESIKQIRALVKNPNLIIWQRNYYEHIIRNEGEYDRIRYYIKMNLRNWEEDRNNPDNLT